MGREGGRREEEGRKKGGREKGGMGREEQEEGGRGREARGGQRAGSVLTAPTKYMYIVHFQTHEALMLPL